MEKVVYVFNFLNYVFWIWFWVFVVFVVFVVLLGFVDLEFVYLMLMLKYLLSGLLGFVFVSLLVVFMSIVLI